MFGGFTNISWTSPYLSEKKHRHDGSSFLFKLIHNSQFERIENVGNEEVNHSKTLGIRFRNAIKILNDCDITDKNLNILIGDEYQ